MNKGIIKALSLLLYEASNGTVNANNIIQQLCIVAAELESQEVECSKLTERTTISCDLSCAEINAILGCIDYAKLSPMNAYEHVFGTPILERGNVKEDVNFMQGVLFTIKLKLEQVSNAEQGLISIENTDTGTLYGLSME